MTLNGGRLTDHVESSRQFQSLLRSPAMRSNSVASCFMESFTFRLGVKPIATLIPSSALFPNSVGSRLRTQVLGSICLNVEQSAFFNAKLV
jgi:hypothetical protein